MKTLRARTASHAKEGLLALGVWLALFVTNPGGQETVDVEIRRMVARQLWTTGDVTLTSIPSGDLGLAWVRGAHGRWAAPYGIGQTLMFLPFDAAGSLLERLSPPGLRERVAWLPIGLGLLPMIGVFFWLAIRKVLEEEGIDRQWALRGSLAITFGTIVFHYLGQGQEEMLVGLFLTLSVLFALRLRSAPTLGNALLSGAFVGASLITRPIALFSLLIVPALLWSAARETRTRARLFAAAAVPLCLSLLIILWYNFARFGSPFTVGYDRLGHFSKMALDARSPRIFLSLLIGPGFGLLVLSPILLLSIWGFGPLWKRDRFYFVGMTAAVLSCYVFFSAWHDSYNGGVAWGTRYQCHLLPLLALPLTLGLRRLAGLPRWRIVVAAVVGVSLGIQLLSVVAPPHLEYAETGCRNGSSDDALENSPTKGLLALRIQNFARWVTHAGPPPCDDPRGDPVIAATWDRYVPNFWGPVIARRISRGGGPLLALWSGLGILGIVLLAYGTRRALREPLDFHDSLPMT